MGFLTLVSPGLIKDSFSLLGLKVQHAGKQLYSIADYRVVRRQNVKQVLLGKGDQHPGSKEPLGHTLTSDIPI